MTSNDKQPDQIKIENLRTHGVIGIRNPERLTPQDILVSVTMDVDLRRIAQTDVVADGVNYSDVSRRISAHVATAERYTIETLAMDIAGLCLSYGLVRQVRVRISKPAADRAAQAVAVEMTRTYADIVAPALIAIGSNELPEDNLREAVRRMSPIGKVAKVSRVYESEMAGQSGTAPFLNAVIRVDTCLPAAEVRRELKKIEADMGRTSESKSAGRIPIDLDLCLLGAQLIRAKDVSIPHAEVSTREYVAKGCAEVWPDARHPETQELIADIAKRLSGTMKLIERRELKLI
jgi:2-amino-4-hydroxy-6-hydroxymethyldihydropteridine diphosphokinase